MCASFNDIPGGSTRGGHVAYIQLDSSDAKQIEKIIDLLPTDFQHVDILVNNAGMGLGNDLVGDINAEELSQVFSGYSYLDGRYYCVDP